jgi:hypothetical protein
MSPRFNSSFREPSAVATGRIHGQDHCPSCGNFLCGAYYRIEGKTACVICAIQALARQKDETRTSSVLGRMFGLVGANPPSFNKLDGPHRA